MVQFASHARAFSVLLSVASTPLLAQADTGPALVDIREPAGVDVEAEWEALPSELSRVSDQSAVVLRGEILTTREDIGGPGPVTVVAIVVDEVLRGDATNGSVVEIEMPLDGPISGDRPANPVPVRGYDVVVFLDEDGDVVDGGIMLVEGGYAWRPSRSGVLLSPRLQRDWEDIIDPIGEYDVFSMDEIRSASAQRRTGTSNSRRSRRSK